MAQAITRRGFLRGCSGVVAGMAGARLTGVAIASPEAPVNDEILVVVSIRGGWDALNVFMPLSGDDRGYYEAARSHLKVPTSGTGAALPLNAQIGMHPSLAPLLDLYQAQKLAVIHAAGLTSDTRSHFDAMEFIELGTPGIRSTTTGWITRHLTSAPDLPDVILMPAIAAGSNVPTSLAGSSEVAAISSPTSFSFSGYWKYAEDQRAALRRMYTGDTWLHEAGLRTLDAIDIVETAAPATYVPANGAVYPAGSFGDSLKTAAQMIKLGVGLRVATVDIGGWDTHQYQGDGSGGYLAEQLTELAQGLAAFYKDLDGAGNLNYTKRLTTVVMSEFGRRLRENADHGTDHGHGSAMLVLGGNVNGGQVYGAWPGLANEQLYDRADLAVTTDYRRVLSEIVVERMGNPNLGVVFPGYSGYQSLDIVRARPVYNHEVFVSVARR
jgi:uncharacterized protein (DUF1501 family)